eukprot:695828-Hanusia_phi.AAC.3
MEKEERGNNSCRRAVKEIAKMEDSAMFVLNRGGFWDRLGELSTAQASLQSVVGWKWGGSDPGEEQTCSVKTCEDGKEPIPIAAFRGSKNTSIR